MGHLYMVPIVLARAGRDGWLSIYVTLVPALLLALILHGMDLLFPDRSLVATAINAAGRIIPSDRLIMGYVPERNSLTMRLPGKTKMAAINIIMEIGITRLR